MVVQSRSALPTLARLISWLALLTPFPAYLGPSRLCWRVCLWFPTMARNKNREMARKDKYTKDLLNVSTRHLILHALSKLIKARRRTNSLGGVPSIGGPCRVPTKSKAEIAAEPMVADGAQLAFWQHTYDVAVARNSAITKEVMRCT